MDFIVQVDRRVEDNMNVDIVGCIVRLVRKNRPELGKYINTKCEMEQVHHLASSSLVQAVMSISLPSRLIYLEQDDMRWLVKIDPILNFLLYILFAMDFWYIRCVDSAPLGLYHYFLWLVK